LEKLSKKNWFIFEIITSILITAGVIYLIIVNAILGLTSYNEKTSTP